MLPVELFWKIVISNSQMAAAAGLALEITATIATKLKKNLLIRFPISLTPGITA